MSEELGTVETTKSGKTAAKKALLSQMPTTPLTVSREELLANGSDQMFRQLVHDIFAFNARHAAIRDGHARRIGLAGIEYTILISVARLSRAGNVNVKALADHLHVSTGFVTNVTRKLQGRGLIEKTTDALDRRRTVLTVTQTGSDKLAELAPYQRQVNDVEFSSLSADDFRHLSRIVAALVNSSEQAVNLQLYLEKTAGAVSVV
ncbi:MAG: MarR family winged helix-turn-helix transcriptional regulator [Pseudomonadota bacterium]|nr:MarR family winged helix-turn-helix transcriptional regulator [Pseudomonadota bacterium]